MQLHPNQYTMQYGLYRLAWRGWVRLSATQSSTMHENQILPARTSLRSNQGWVRRYEFFSGLPVWMDSEGNQSFRHPDYPNAHRDFRWTSQQAGVWAWHTLDKGRYRELFHTFILATSSASTLDRKMIFDRYIYSIYKISQKM